MAADHKGLRREHHLDHRHRFVAGIIARLLAPGPNNPSGFILTTLLGIVGAFVATQLGQFVGFCGRAGGDITVTEKIPVVSRRTTNETSDTRSRWPLPSPS